MGPHTISLLDDLFSCEHCMAVLSWANGGQRHECDGPNIVTCVVVDTNDSEIQLIEERLA